MSAIDLIDDWLDSKRCTLWGTKKDIVDPDGRRAAAAWFKQQIEDFHTFNSGVAIQLRDEEIDVPHLRAEHEAAVAEIESLRDRLKAAEIREGRALAERDRARRSTGWRWAGTDAPPPFRVDL